MIIYNSIINSNMASSEIPVAPSIIENNHEERTLLEQIKRLNLDPTQRVALSTHLKEIRNRFTKNIEAALFSAGALLFPAYLLLDSGFMRQYSEKLLQSPDPRHQLQGFIGEIVIASAVGLSAGLATKSLNLGYTAVRDVITDLTNTVDIITPSGVAPPSNPPPPAQGV